MSDSESSTASLTLHTENPVTEPTTCTTTSPNIKVIPIAINTNHAAMPPVPPHQIKRRNRSRDRSEPEPRHIPTPSITDISTVSTIEDLLAQKVERIANHLETANNNILHVDGKIKNYQSENSNIKSQLNKNNESFQILNNLKDQIDQSLLKQTLVHDKLNKSIKKQNQIFSQHQANFAGKYGEVPAPSGGGGVGAGAGFDEHNLTAPVILPTSNYAGLESRHPDLNQSAPNLRFWLGEILEFLAIFGEFRDSSRDSFQKRPKIQNFAFSTRGRHQNLSQPHPP